jgi:hypothetical protein
MRGMERLGKYFVFLNILHTFEHGEIEVRSRSIKAGVEG